MSSQGSKIANILNNNKRKIDEITPESTNEALGLNNTGIGNDAPLFVEDRKGEYRPHFVDDKRVNEIPSFTNFLYFPNHISFSSRSIFDLHFELIGGRSYYKKTPFGDFIIHKIDFDMISLLNKIKNITEIKNHHYITARKIRYMFDFQNGMLIINKDFIRRYGIDISLEDLELIIKNKN
jgi:hypothetical protein